MAPKYNYLLQELNKLDEDISLIPDLIKRGLTLTEAPEARRRILVALDEIQRLRKLAHQLSSETERHNWHTMLDRRQQVHHLTLENVIRAEFSVEKARS